MKHPFSLSQLVLPLAASFGLCAVNSQAAPHQTLSQLTAQMQKAADNNPEKSFDEKFILPPVSSTLAGTQKKLAGQPDAPKHLLIDPLTAIPPEPRNMALTRYKGLAMHLGKNNAQSPPVKRLGAQLSFKPKLK